MKQERLMEENSLDAPSQWLQSFNDNRSFLNVFLSMATVSMGMYAVTDALLRMVNWVKLDRQRLVDKSIMMYIRL